MSTPEALARTTIDAALTAAGWCVQDAGAANLSAGAGVAVREFSQPGLGEADYLLFAGGQAVGAVEAKKVGTTLTGVEVQSAKYGAGLPPYLAGPAAPLPLREHGSRNPLHRPARPRSPEPPHLRLSPARDDPRLARGPAWRRDGPDRCRHRRGTGGLRPSPVAARPPPPHAPDRPALPLAGPTHRGPQPGTVAGRGPSPLPDPDGHRQWQDLHRDHRHLPDGEVGAGV